MTHDTYEPEPKFSDAIRLKRLVGMLRNTLRSYPKARLWRFRGGFGASLGGHAYIRVSYSGPLSAEDMRDLLALFATWCAVEPGYVMCTACERPVGHFAQVELDKLLSRGQQV